MLSGFSACDVSPSKQNIHVHDMNNDHKSSLSQMTTWIHGSCNLSPRYKTSGIRASPIYTWRNYEFTWTVCKFTVIRSLITVQLHGLNKNPHTADMSLHLKETQRKDSSHCNSDTEADGKIVARPMYILRHILSYLGNEIYCCSVDNCWLLKTMTSMWSVEPVSRKQTFRVRTHSARNCIFLKMPPIQF
jgi:hypothetical protein